MINTVKPFLKWVGGKYNLANELKKHLPSNFYQLAYIEPMLGGAGMFFNLQPKTAILSDINEKLIVTYQSIQNNVEGVIFHLKEHGLNHRTNENYYYEVRKHFNNGYKTSEEQSAAFIYLNKTNFNGLYRVNSKGEFNVPKGRTTSGNVTICDEKVLKDCSMMLKDVVLHCKSYEDALKDLNENCFVYLDPPYLPQTDVSFTKYSQQGFSIEDHKILSTHCKDLSEKGIRFMMSNAENDYTYDIYGDFTIKPLTVYHSIGPNKKTRRIAKECIITNY